MTGDPFRHFLGVEDASDPLALLDLSADEARDPRRLENALFRRTMQTFRKEGGHGPEAERVRWRLRAAAAVLKDPGAADRIERRKAQLAAIEGAVEHMLGVSGSVDPFGLLGLPVRPCSAAAIDAALLKRIADTYSHAEARSDAAEAARTLLRATARALKNPEYQEKVLEAARTRAAREARRTPVATGSSPNGRRRTPRLNLTPFDRQALAILVGCGGWNHSSRARLVSLASTYGVTVTGLMKVIRGLSDYAKSGGPRLGTAEIAPGVEHLDAVPLPPRLRVEPDRMERLVAALDEKFSAAFAEDSASARIRLSIAFGVVTIVVLVIAVGLLFRSPDGADPAPAGQRPPVVAAVPGAGPGSRDAARPERSHVLRFPTPPTFTGRGIPVQAINAADACPLLPAALEEIQQRLAATARPDEAVFVDWDEAIRTISVAWALLDGSTRSEVESGVRDVLAAADIVEVRNRLWESLAPIPPERPTTPLDIWRGTWLAGMLTDLGRRTTLPPAVVERARTLLGLVVPADAAAGAGGFDDGVRLWLEQAIDGLVGQTELDAQTYEYWDLWLAAARRLSNPEARNDLLISAAYRFLVTPTDLARVGPSTNVLGRLLHQADFRTSPVVRRRFLDLFEDERITSDDLWVLTSMLVQFDAAPWFERDLVVPYEADMVYRRRSRDRIADRWPAVRIAATRDPLAQGRGLAVDADHARRWRDLLRRVDALLPSNEPDTQMTHLLAACALNEAATYLSVGELVEALESMIRLEAMLESGTAVAPGGAGVQAGQSVGRDGEWSASYELARNNRDEMVALIRQLRATAGSDLGPLDAATLVREAYRGGGQEIRLQAQAMVSELFSLGPNVVLELLDQLAGAPGTESVSDLIQQVTSEPLPRVRDDNWEAQARRALVRHALRLLAPYDLKTDRLAVLVGQSYQRRAATGRRDVSPPMMFPSPEEAARDRLAVLTLQAEAVMVTDPAPDDLAGLQRRDAMRMRLAEGPIQRFVAAQTAVLDMLAYLAVAEHPAARQRVLESLGDAASRRGTSGHVLQQSVEVERAIARMWALRFEEVTDDS